MLLFIVLLPALVGQGTRSTSMQPLVVHGARADEAGEEAGEPLLGNRARK